MRENISALMDGELDERAAHGAIDELCLDPAALDTWRNYHLISDSLRRCKLLSDSFGARVAEKLAAEPTVLAPARLRAEPRKRIALPAAVAASIAAVALVGWLAFAPHQGADSLPPPIARAPAIPPVAVPALPAVEAGQPTVALAPSATNDYLLAHQGFSPRLSLQGIAPYVRTVSDSMHETRK